MAETSFDSSVFVRDFLNADRLYTTSFTTLNGSGVTGSALLAVEDDRLTVLITAAGLEAGQPHPQHIHGFLSGQDAKTPTLANDTDGDGFVELAEGLPEYGPILLTLTSPQGVGLEGFPTAPNGQITFIEHYHIGGSNPDGVEHHGSLDSGLPVEDLDLREIVLHGMTVGAVGGGTEGEVNGIAEYKAVLPVASGELTEVPFQGDNVLSGTRRSDVLNGTAEDDRLYGQGGNDRLSGKSGNDKLFGGTGNDRLSGDSGNDRLWGDDGNDRLAGGTGNDRLSGGDGNDRLDGGTGGDHLLGGAGKDVLIGGTGDDWLSGGLGRDALTGGAGRDTFVFNQEPTFANADRITDFNVQRDTIALEDTFFTGLIAGATLDAMNFHITSTSTLAQDADDRVIYHRTTGALYYDEDGTGGVAAIRFAQLDARLALTSADFAII